MLRLVKITQAKKRVDSPKRKNASKISGSKVAHRYDRAAPTEKKQTTSFARLLRVSCLRLVLIVIKAFPLRAVANTD